MGLNGLSLGDTLVGVISIVLMDLLLGADNAIVIGMACRGLDPKIRTKGIVLGTVGAVVVRAAATVAVVWLLRIQFIMLAGGIVLVYIGYKLVAKQDDGHDVTVKSTLRQAVLTVIVADLLMGIDNVLAVAGAANDSFALVIFGLCLSVPIMVFGSTLVIKLMERFPFIVYIGAALIFYTGAHMVAKDKSVAHWFEAHKAVEYAMIAAVVVGGLLVSWLAARKKAPGKTKESDE